MKTMIYLAACSACAYVFKDFFIKDVFYIVFVLIIASWALKQVKWHKKELDQ